LRHLATIGYEGRSAEQLLADLRAQAVTTLVDVRLTPLSHKPGLSKRRLAEALAAAGLAYVHLPALGNPKDNRAGLRAGALESRQRYAGVLRSPVGDEALTTVVDLVRRERVALLCVERDPATCHRLLIAGEVVRRSPGLGVRHL
jgi:uncharacterized protein (DUF488 family)